MSVYLWHAILPEANYQAEKLNQIILEHLKAASVGTRVYLLSHRMCVCVCAVMSINKCMLL